MKYEIDRRTCSSVLSRKVVAVAFSILLLAMLLAIVQAETKLVDKDTKFHRLYVTGPGESRAWGLWNDESAFKNDRNELKNDLEREGNQKAGSTSRVLEKPTKQQLGDALNQLKSTAESGDEVTFSFIGHGNGGKDGGLISPGEPNDPFDEWIWLNDPNGSETADSLDEILTDDELSDMLEGFGSNVTIVVIMDSCFGGGFTGGGNDIQESDHVSVIGTSSEGPIDPPFVFGGLVSTPAEDVADGAGEKAADKNGDGIVTAAELKEWLTGRNWKLGPPDDQNPGKIKNGKSKIIGFEGAPVESPSITPNTYAPSPGSNVILAGRDFASDSTVSIRLVKTDLTELNMGYAQTAQDGSFTKTITVPSTPGSQFLLIAEDTEGNLDWNIWSITTGGLIVFVDSPALLAPYIGLTSTILVATGASAVYGKRVKHRKERQRA